MALQFSVSEGLLSQLADSTGKAKYVPVADKVLENFAKGRQLRQQDRQIEQADERLEMEKKEAAYRRTRDVLEDKHKERMFKLQEDAFKLSQRDFNHRMKVYKDEETKRTMEMQILRQEWELNEKTMEEKERNALIRAEMGQLDMSEKPETLFPKIAGIVARHGGDYDSVATILDKLIEDSDTKNTEGTGIVKAYTRIKLGGVTTEDLPEISRLLAPITGGKSLEAVRVDDDQGTIDETLVLTIDGKERVLKTSDVMASAGTAGVTALQYIMSDNRQMQARETAAAAREWKNVNSIFGTINDIAKETAGNEVNRLRVQQVLQEMKDKEGGLMNWFNGESYADNVDMYESIISAAIQIDLTRNAEALQSGRPADYILSSESIRTAAQIIRSNFATPEAIPQAIQDKMSNAPVTPSGMYNNQPTQRQMNGPTPIPVPSGRSAMGAKPPTRDVEASPRDLKTLADLEAKYPKQAGETDQQYGDRLKKHMAELLQ